ncbi:uncharacterized protein LOC123644372 [Lemur catta]|uniref:uncharacterized protein LOC123644372 n=1 Tax=Lemur catta TaxID=9447 RepID=UPI001E2679A0|nr:uncharacterized protein LOC123644372 [Lemur catta]
MMSLFSSLVFRSGETEQKDLCLGSQAGGAASARASDSDDGILDSSLTLGWLVKQHFWVCFQKRLAFGSVARVKQIHPHQCGWAARICEEPNGTKAPAPFWGQDFHLILSLGVRTQAFGFGLNYTPAFLSPQLVGGKSWDFLASMIIVEMTLQGPPGPRASCGIGCGCGEVTLLGSARPPTDAPRHRPMGSLSVSSDKLELLRLTQESKQLVKKLHANGAVGVNPPGELGPSEEGEGSSRSRRPVLSTEHLRKFSTLLVDSSGTE